MQPVKMQCAAISLCNKPLMIKAAGHYCAPVGAIFYTLVVLYENEQPVRATLSKVMSENHTAPPPCCGCVQVWVRA